MSAMPDHADGGPEWQGTAEKKARRIRAEERQRRGRDADEVARQRQGDAEKVKIATRAQADTTLFWYEVAQKGLARWMMPTFQDGGQRSPSRWSRAMGGPACS
ncbi:MAG TPA: hypothetical protein VN829_01060 [Dongiaceae bacterium]|nr:hypothetical protein [Dongiaceae bacterium]